MSAPRHPGEIVFVDETSEQVRLASTVPASLRFARRGGKDVPVLRVVARRVGNRREIQEFGAKGVLLRTTIQRRSSRQA